MATTGLGLVPSPPAVPPTVGLIPSLSGDYLDPPDTGYRWEGGVRYNPEQPCSVGGSSEPCSVATRDTPDNPDNVDFVPFYIWAGDDCTPLTGSERDRPGRARRALIATESYLIARELWLGTIAKGATPDWPNNYLARDDNTDTLTSGPVSVTQALECLEQGIGYYGLGAPGAIHCTRELGAAFSALGSTLRVADGRILTYMGTTIIPDAGYDGSGPQGQPAVNGSQYAYATLMPTVRRGPIEVVPESAAGAVTRDVNNMSYIAQRLAAVTFPPCVQVAVEVDLPLCLVAGTS